MKARARLNGERQQSGKHTAKPVKTFDAKRARTLDLPSKHERAAMSMSFQVQDKA